MRKIDILALLCFFLINAGGYEPHSITTAGGWRIEKIAHDSVLFWCIADGRGSGRFISTSGKIIREVGLSPTERYIVLMTDKGVLFWDRDMHEFAKTGIDPEIVSLIGSK